MPWNSNDDGPWGAGGSGSSNDGGKNNNPWNNNNNIDFVIIEPKKRKIKPQLLKTVKKFREDELEHHDTGVEHQAEMTTGYVLLSKTIKQLCYTAIKISKKY